MGQPCHGKGAAARYQGLGTVVRRRTVPVPGGRLATVSAISKAPAPRLRAIREAWLWRAIERLESDPAIGAAGFVGSFGRGDADDWSDVDLLIVVPDDQAGHYADATQLPGSELVTWSIDARQNAPRGASAIGVDYSIDGLPLHVDWYVYPRSQAAWAADARVIFDEQGLRRLGDTFREHLDKREVQPPAPKAANAHRLLQVSLVPVAAKYVARRSADAGRMVEFVGGPYLPEGTPAEYLTVLRQLLGRYREDAPEEMLAPVGRYLDLVEATP
jgi:predicted nucleotidyltransferase